MNQRIAQSVSILSMFKSFSSIASTERIQTKISKKSDPQLYKNLIEKHCRCTVCQMWRINPLKSLACPCCHGCLKSSDPDESPWYNMVLKKTIEYINKNTSYIIVDESEKLNGHIKS